MITIDGASGGGQILRNAIALAAVRGAPVRVTNIRAQRPKPGLRPQHLLGLRAVAELCCGELQGAEIGSSEISFAPGTLQSRTDWQLDVGTAGSVTLLLQMLLPALAHTPEPSSVTLIGGTDVPFSPPIDYLVRTLLPALRLMGVEAEVQLLQRGFYPKGGGRVLGADAADRAGAAHHSDGTRESRRSPRDCLQPGPACAHRRPHERGRRARVGPWRLWQGRD